MGLGRAAREVWSSLGGDKFHRSVSIHLAEREADRRRVARKVSKLPQGSLSSQAIEQLTSIGLSRHGQPELEVEHQWQGKTFSLRSKISLHNLSSTVTTTNGHRRCIDRCKVPELWNPDTCKKRLLIKMRFAKHVENEDTWQMSKWTRTDTKTREPGTGKGSGKLRAMFTRTFCVDTG